MKYYKNPTVREKFGGNTLFRNCLRSCLFLLLLISVLMPYSAPAQLDGIELFKQEKYGQAIRFFSTQLKAQPDNPAINFYLGRSLLALKKVDKAVGYLEKAAQRAPDNPDYRFWLGVGYWADMEFEKERQSYLEALKLDPGHLQANLYLGHNFMDQNQWKAALNQYDRVLAVDPAVPDALYNRALVFRQLGRISDEKKAWHSYLRRYRRGQYALQAVDYLNGYGDFSYRIYLLRSRRIVVPAIHFEPAGSTIKAESLPAVETIGGILTRNRALSVHVIAYVKGSAELAKYRAKAIKKALLKAFPGIKPSRIMTSWFGVPEKIDLRNEAYMLDESVNVITQK